MPVQVLINVEPSGQERTEVSGLVVAWPGRVIGAEGRSPVGNSYIRPCLTNPTSKNVLTAWSRPSPGYRKGRGFSQPGLAGQGSRFH